MMEWFENRFKFTIYVNEGSVFRSCGLLNIGTFSSQRYVLVFPVFLSVLRNNFSRLKSLVGPGCKSSYIEMRLRSTPITVRKFIEIFNHQEFLVL